jgi:hypothetical protein
VGKPVILLEMAAIALHESGVHAFAWCIALPAKVPLTNPIQK